MVAWMLRVSIKDSKDDEGKRRKVKIKVSQ